MSISLIQVWMDVSQYIVQLLQSLTLLLLSKWNAYRYLFNTACLYRRCQCEEPFLFVHHDLRSILADYSILYFEPYSTNSPPLRRIILVPKGRQGIPGAHHTPLKVTVIRSSFSRTFTYISMSPIARTRSCALFVKLHLRLTVVRLLIRC